MKPRIIGIGTALPPHGVEQERAAEHAGARCCETEAHARSLAALYRRSGVARRNSVLLGGDDGFFEIPNGRGRRGPSTQRRMQRYADDAVNLAADACSAALGDAAIERGAVTHLVTVSCTGFAAPGVDIALIKGLGLGHTVQRTHVGFMGCHGALNGLRVAAAIATSDPSAVVLLCAVELCSLHFAYGWNPQRIVANSLFADGAGAMIISGSSAGTAASDGAWHIALSGAALLPECEDAMTWVIGDHGFEMTLSPRVPGLIDEHLEPWLGAWLSERDLSIDDIGSWAVHPGGPRVVDHVRSSLSLPNEAVEVSRQVLSECGNMSSATVLFILERLMRGGAARPCVALAFGPGLAAEAALFT